jgi:hypothetical protein
MPTASIAFTRRMESRHVSRCASDDRSLQSPTGICRAQKSDAAGESGSVFEVVELQAARR